MSVLRISLFRRFQVWLDQQVLTSLNARKVQELFCYLLLYRHRPHPREALASLLWGGSSTAQSKKYLRQALWQLQAALDAQAELIDGRPLLVESDWVQFNTGVDFWLDVAAFEEAAGRFRGVRGRDLDPPGARTLEQAVQLYRGDLLEGWYQDWCLYERERLQNVYLAVLDKLMGYCEVHGDCETGLRYGLCILRYDRARERTHRRLMRLEYLGGDRTAALRQYERCVAALEEELGVGPAARTVALYEHIRADRLDRPALAPVEEAAVPGVMASPLSELLDRLRQLGATLADVQCHVQQDIQAIEQALGDWCAPGRHR